MNILNVHGVKNVRQTETHTAEPSSFEVYVMVYGVMTLCSHVVGILPEDHNVNLYHHENLNSCSITMRTLILA
jgi:hypothetical protein